MPAFRLRRAALVVCLALVGCDGIPFGTGDCYDAPPLVERVDRFIVRGVAEQDSLLVLSDTLRGEFRFVVQGVLRPTSGSYDCGGRPGANVEGIPVRAEVRLDTTIRADGELVAAGTDLVPYLRDGDADRLFNVDRDFPKPETSVALDTSRVEVPEGHHKLSLRWFTSLVYVAHEAERDVVYVSP